MRISPVSAYNRTNYGFKKVNENPSPISQVEFKGKHTCAKAGAGIMGGLGSLGAIGGLLIVTGGVVLPIVVGYGAVCAATGAILGHQVDKGLDEDEKKS